jgi:hypothetical protein
VDLVGQEGLRDHMVKVRRVGHMDTDPQVQEDLWEDPRLVQLQTVIHIEVHLLEQFQHKALVVLRCHMVVLQICKTYKGC